MLLRTDTVTVVAAMRQIKILCEWTADFHVKSVGVMQQ